MAAAVDTGTYPDKAIVAESEVRAFDATGQVVYSHSGPLGDPMS